MHRGRDAAAIGGRRVSLLERAFQVERFFLVKFLLTRLIPEGDLAGGAAAGAGGARAGYDPWVWLQGGAGVWRWALPAGCLPIEEQVELAVVLVGGGRGRGARRRGVRAGRRALPRAVVAAPSASRRRVRRPATLGLLPDTLVS